MPPVSTLDQAAREAQDRLYSKWLSNGLQSGLTNFCSALIPVFPDGEPNGRPVANWLTVMWALAAEMNPLTMVLVPVVNYTQANIAAQYMYHMCFLTQELQIKTLITSGQVTLVLAAYNANF